jgi:hypothetical protein
MEIMAQLFDYIKRLTSKKPIDETQDSFEKDYSPYMVNRFFACDRKLLMLAKEMNQSGITKQMHFDFMDTIVPKSNKFIKYNLKKAKADKDIQYICDYYQVNLETAKSYYKILKRDKKQMKMIRDFYEKRGTK